MERELLLLGFLRRSNMHGYRLNEFIERDMGERIDLKKPTAYFLLEKMAKMGWITEHSDQEGNRPPRRVYQITPEGEAQFQRLLRENLASHLPATFAGDIGLAFADTLDVDEALALLAERRRALVADLEEARATPEHAGALQFIIQHRIVHLEAELRWLDEVTAQLERSGRQSSSSNHS